MIRLAIQSIHEANQEICGHEVLARKVIDGDRVSAPGIFMAESKAEDWFTLDMEVYGLVAHSNLLIQDPWPLFINMSPATLEIEGYFRRALDLVVKISQSRGASTVIEISEESDISDSLLKDRMKELRCGGLQIAMDDFGVGYSNLDRLVRHNWSYCKIDLHCLATANNLDWLIEAKVHCDEHKIGIVLERFETNQGKDLLWPFRNSLYQGYAFSMPRILNDVEPRVMLSRSLG